MAIGLSPFSLHFLSSFPLLLRRNGDIYHLQGNHLAVFDAELVIILEHQVHKFCAIDAANDGGVIQVYLGVMGVVRQGDEQAIISLAHRAFQGLDGAFFDISILALDLNNNAGREFIFIGRNVDSSVSAMW